MPSSSHSAIQEKSNTEATCTAEKPSWLSQGRSQQEVLKVLQEQSSPGLVPAHPSSSCSMVIGATTVGSEVY